MLRMKIEAAHIEAARQRPITAGQEALHETVSSQQTGVQVSNTGFVALISCFGVSCLMIE